MRGLFLLLLVGCDVSTSSHGDPGGGGFDLACTQDSECGAANVCARIGGCVAAGDVRSIHVTWTLNGQPASADTCSANPDLEIDFSGDGGFGVGFEPVPCAEGKFSIDKMPVWYTRVELGKPRGSFNSANLDDATGEAAIDLQF
jgi:hypothetical protein